MTKRELFDEANKLDQTEHRDLILSLLMFHVNKYGEEYLSVKAKAWLNRHGWIKITLSVILSVIACIFLFNSCSTTVSQSNGEQTSTYSFTLDKGVITDALNFFIGKPSYEVPTVTPTK